ncbi:MAG: sigma-70 family RNA polymerase sigma factor [Thermoguttaceae bacterium]|nr:sigma-70 family RNA polymerase sigma factor [Thermoguttaceae bacterium]
MFHAAFSPRRLDATLDEPPPSPDGAPLAASAVVDELDKTGVSAPVERPDFVSESGEIDWNAALSVNESRLRSTIAARVGETAAVDEVFQDVALAATRQRAPIRDPRKIVPWLQRLATVYSLLYRRSVGRKKKLLRSYQERIPVAESTGADEEPLRWLLSEERRSLVRQATARLAEDERRILALKYAEDKSYKEIATELDSTVSAVQSKLHRARARLRELLAELAPT